MRFTSKTDGALRVGSTRLGGVTWLSGAFLAANSVLAPLAAQDWTAAVETEAETAYRAIHARSFAKERPAVQSAWRTNAEPAPRVTSAIIPDLPARKIAMPAEAAAAETPAADAVPSDQPQAQPQIEAKALAEPPIPKPDGLGETLTTQVLSAEPDAAAAAAEPKPSPQTIGDQFCKSIANAATDARFVWQKQTLADTEKQVEKRVEELNTKIVEYQKWLARRDEFSRKAQSIIIDIYAKMKPDAAALQLTALDEETAAAVITKLTPKISSAVMAEMDAKKAARLTAIIAGSSKGPKGKPPAQPASGGT
jgi:flagellar motility protein MotE (MotC chaperone)